MASRTGGVAGSLDRLAGAIGLAFLASGCSLISIDDVGVPFGETPPYGEVVQEIRIEGNNNTRTWIVERAMASKVGEPYTEENARTDYRWLAQLGVFTAINFATEDVPGGIALVVLVREVSPYLPSISFRLTEENGIEIGPAFSSPNLFGTAARASAYVRFGGATNFGVKYADPWMPGKSWLFGYQLQYSHIERDNVLDDFREKTDDVYFQFKRNLTNTLRPGVRFEYLTVASDTPGKTLSPDNRDNIPAAALFLEYDTRNGQYPTRGWFNEFEVAKWGMFGVDTDYWQFTFNVQRYLTLPFGRRHSVALYSLATLTTGTVGVDIPIYLDFHIGGTNSVRGWPLDSRVGKNQWLNTAEYWYALMDPKAFRFWFIRWRMGLQLAVFGDIGTAWYSGSEFSENWIGGFGGGLRLTMPVITVIRLDLAYARSDFGIQIAVGGGEKALAQRMRVR